MDPDETEIMKKIKSDAFHDHIAKDLFVIL